MDRQVYIVFAQIVDSTGKVSFLDGYPKTFDSNNYQGDAVKARRRAEGDMSEVWSAMCKRDDRQIQTVFMTSMDGFQLDVKTNGRFAE